MKRLTLKEASDFVAFAQSKVTSISWVHILKDFCDDNSSVTGEAIRSLHQNLIGGKSFQDAIRGMSIPFPKCIECVLVSAYENSILDHGLNDINVILSKHDSEEETFDSLSRLVDKYANASYSDMICEGCLALELEIILKRAELEEASEVIFEQDSERFLIQRYIGAKAVRYIQPCHSKVYRTLLWKMNALSDTRTSITLSGKVFTAEKLDNGSFILRADHNVELKLSFQ